jgi:hypothetical protein
MTARIPRRLRLATLAEDGWSLLDVERAYRARDGVYWVPPAEARRALRPGALARLLFAWADAAPDDPGRERLWVEVERIEDGGRFVGRLLNEPVAVAPIGEGARIPAGPEHVLDVVSAPGERSLSERSDLVRCEGHGWSEPCFVCEHVTEGEDLGFHEGGDPARLRPDAWCDACDLLVVGVEGWGEVEPHPRVVLVCGGCYDLFRDRNRQARG